MSPLHATRSRRTFEFRVLFVGSDELEALQPHVKFTFFTLNL